MADSNKITILTANRYAESQNAKNNDKKTNLVKTVETLTLIK